MAKRNWAKDRQLRNMRPIVAKQSLSQVVAGCGRTTYSKAIKSLMPPTKGRHIDPHSPEGKTIASKYNLTE